MSKQQFWVRLIAGLLSGFLFCVAIVVLAVGYLLPFIFVPFLGLAGGGHGPPVRVAPVHFAWTLVPAGILSLAFIAIAIWVLRRGSSSGPVDTTPSSVRSGQPIILVLLSIFMIGIATVSWEEIALRRFAAQEGRIVGPLTPELAHDRVQPFTANGKYYFKWAFGVPLVFCLAALVSIVIIGSGVLRAVGYLWSVLAVWTSVIAVCVSVLIYSKLRFNGVVELFT